MKYNSGTKMFVLGKWFPSKIFQLYFAIGNITEYSMLSLRIKRAQHNTLNSAAKHQTTVNHTTVTKSP
jgi:hypothetical protein